MDDKPYGGGVGMVLKADVLTRSVKSVKCKVKSCKIILTSASGKTFTQKKAQALSISKHLIIVCGHYEGVDQRFIDKYVDEEISIGDYVLTGGEVPAMVIVDATTRLIPGVLKKPEAIQNESFSGIRHLNSNIRLLEHPQYTRPESFEGLKVPKVLLSGNHKEIEKWKTQKSLRKTQKIRPDLLKK